MKNEAYEVGSVSADYDVIDFISKGKNGDISKRIMITPYRDENVYWLEFGDVGDDNEINDLVVTNNGDRDKVLATVANMVNGYTIRYPDRLVFFSGSTKSRKRLYRMVISIYLEELLDLYDIFIYNDNRIIPFQKNTEADSFLIKRKKH